MRYEKRCYFNMRSPICSEKPRVEDREDGAWEGKALPTIEISPPNTTDVIPPHSSYHRKCLPVGVSVTYVPVLLSREY